MSFAPCVILIIIRSQTIGRFGAGARDMRPSLGPIGFFYQFHAVFGARGESAKVKKDGAPKLGAPYLGNPGIHDVNVPGYSSLILGKFSN